MNGYRRPAYLPDAGLHCRCALLLIVILSSTGCAVKKFAINKVADSLASQSNSGFATDDDPELIGDALPFALKLMEGLLEQVPRHGPPAPRTLIRDLQRLYAVQLRMGTAAGRRNGTTGCRASETDAAACPKAISARA
jgi:hypothetical protein